MPIAAPICVSAEPLPEAGAMWPSDDSGEDSLRDMTFDRPQSTTSVSPYFPSMMLPGFRSRCSTPRWWAYSMALQTSMKRRSSLRNSNARFTESRFSSSEPWNRWQASLRLSPWTKRIT